MSSEKHSSNVVIIGPIFQARPTWFSPHRHVIGTHAAIDPAKGQLQKSIGTGKARREYGSAFAECGPLRRKASRFSVKVLRLIEMDEAEQRGQGYLGRIVDVRRRTLGDGMGEILKFFPAAMTRLSVDDSFLSVASFSGVGLLASLLVLIFERNLF
jgi:hypothetical protein